MTAIAVIGANGRAGSRIVDEALNRGFDVTAIVRGENRTRASKTIVKDLFELEAEDIAGFDAVVDAFGVFDPNKLSEHSTSLAHLADILSGSPVRLLVVGGAGSLYTNTEHTAQLSDGFPEDIKPVPLAMGKSLDELRQHDDVRWTYLSPAADFQADGERTGAYTLAGENYSTDANGISAISYADYAIAVVDEIEHGSHIGERISVRW
ncbi:MULTISPECIES: NAD(P)-dependent oxidoreductase [Bifidobacterium]|jgi:putative NADH-flavin reductase|uniref:NAD(P)-dependent oxidoreductase n=1 Tax=Bifidobacterium tibiigranuli TaxID=2172043 RepID=A0A5N6S0E6_9BIFI|nr:NAD(P)H-binding protein [Bifidobacterium tibiigranuli]KAE8128015.1 NAD(P)-dependent oxidoreductase [Bifidobacterium tibiigranuli]KAE8128176.1 NAD(P)-dependent oxidoreductase [Bifidobacterium tibiigranuli]MCI1211194.1 NAD(P)H-binding protein [Bifidobacterium tibiigranuli]MCI1220296.1 NAD(P)H-binding protein [Bifidobacterium tibiigranuli]MCI1232021.1 NAD(P)H-binding protein [Bifidobacterium tibiigranuli]